MKLYQVKQNTWVKLDGQRLFFVKIDGMYSICEDEYGVVHHIAAFTEVEVE